MFSSDQPLLGNALPISWDFPRDQEELNETLVLIYKRIASSVNGKISALYTPQESSNFQQFFTPGNPNRFRNVYRKVFDITSLNKTVLNPTGAIPPGAMAGPFPHDIVGLLETTFVYSSASTTPPRFFSFMYPYVFLDSVDVFVTNPDAANPLTQCYVIAEYVKN